MGQGARSFIRRLAALGLSVAMLTAAARGVPASSDINSGWLAPPDLNTSRAALFQQTSVRSFSDREFAQIADFILEYLPGQYAEPMLRRLVVYHYQTSWNRKLFSRHPLEEKNIETIIYGRSGAGRELLAYRFGRGENVLLLSFAIHAWEDNFDRDGQMLVDTAEALMAVLDARYDELVVAGNWTVYVLPCLNPDGLYDGWTCYGPGRCTTYYLNGDGRNTEGDGIGIDMNRCFPYAFRSQYNARNYCGSQPLQSREALALARFTEAVLGEGNNVLIDTHGWYRQTLVSGGWDGALYQTFRQYFPGNQYVSLRGASGYYSAWAAYELGYDACLFEFPYVSSARDFREKEYAQDYVDAICTLLTAYE